MKQMNELAERYGAVLFELALPETEIRLAAALFAETPALTEVLSSPAVKLSQKLRVLVRVFGKEGAGLSETMVRFLAKLCEADGIGAYAAVVRAWERISMERAGCLSATLYYVTAPDSAQRSGIEAFLKQRFGAKEIRLTEKQEPSLLGGFLLKAGDTEFDYSLRGRMQKLRRAVTG